MFHSIVVYFKFIARANVDFHHHDGAESFVATIEKYFLRINWKLVEIHIEQYFHCIAAFDI